MALSAISLCAGVGGIDLGLRLADPTIRTVCYVEWEHFPAAVLAARIADGALEEALVWDDVGTFDGRPWRGKVDLITAGFPCQPVSLAGKRLGMADERFIWDDVARIIGEVRPERVLLENVPGILSADDGQFLGRVLGDLAELGFDAEYDLFSAEETGAPHRRLRWFCLAVRSELGNSHDGRQEPADEARALGTERNARSIPRSASGGRHVADAGHGLVPQPGRGPEGRDGTGPAGAVLGHADGAGRQEQRGAVAVRPEQSPAERAVGPLEHAHITGLPPGGCSGTGGWSEPEHAGRVYPPARNDYAGWAGVPADLQPSVEREVRGDADGVATRLDASPFAFRPQRLRAVGNGVVPLTAAVAWIELNERFA